MMRYTPALLIVLFVACGPVLAEEPTRHDLAPWKEKTITAEDRQHWAFVAPTRPALPSVHDRAWVRNPIDAFVLAKLEENGLRPAPEASRSTLLRRLSFDLIGLPPSPAEIEAFVADRSPDAYENVVDRLLASPRYGERWGQHWLDLARYADTDGFEFDQARPDAWRYRDWVVQALNADLPYDAFVRLQLAGDELEPDDPAAFIATGFNRCYPDMVDLNDQGLRRQNALNDITETTGLVYLGLTIGCARCHDHKFDPIRLSDFYRLQAFFTPARFRDDYPVAPPVERAKYERQFAGWESAVARLETELIRLEAPIRSLVAPGLPNLMNDEVVAAWQKDEDDRTPREVHLLYEALVRDRRLRPEQVAALLMPPEVAIRGVLLAALDRLKKTPPKPLPRARGVDEAGPSAPPTYLLRRGDYASKGPEVSPAFPAVLTSPEGSYGPVIAAQPHSSGRRTALASWLTRAENPLTSRVMVNRLWQHHFGRGLVDTPSDFGVMGAEPSHPELLDWLATEFVARGWSLKAMHRLMVTSAAYRQSSRFDREAFALDPENSLVWRHGRQRLDGETIRDALLAVSAGLDGRMGGPPVFPELPAELTRLSSKGAIWPVSPNPGDRNRRSLYVFVRRNLRYPFFEAFDRPDTNASCPRRAVTTIAPQALTLLNSQLALDAARGLARRVEREAGPSVDARVERAFLLAIGRPPSAAERQLAGRFLGRPDEQAWGRFCLAVLNLNEFVYVD